MKGVLNWVALWIAVLTSFLTTVGCADSTCVYGYYGGYCYTYGYYYDSLVSGLSYKSVGEAGEQTGVTGEESEPGPGSFRYVEGDMVSFSLGDTVLGESQAQERITPFDLAGLDEEAFGGCEVDGTLPDTTAFRIVHNVAVLLQTLDTDGDPTNGIDIRPDVAALFEGRNIELSQAWEDFRVDTDLVELLGEANSQELFSDTRLLRDRIDALRALYRGTVEACGG
jgi:para-nitrobenzyl esterase